MKIVVANPNQYAKAVETEDVEKAIAKAIGGGNFDRAPFPKDKDVYIVMGAMHQQLKLVPNRLIDTTEKPFPVFGPFVLCQIPSAPALSAPTTALRMRCASYLV